MPNLLVFGLTEIRINRWSLNRGGGVASTSPLNGPKGIKIVVGLRMAFVLDGCSIHNAYIRSKSRHLICCRHLVKSQESQKKSQSDFFTALVARFLIGELHLRNVVTTLLLYVQEVVTNLI